MVSWFWVAFFLLGIWVRFCSLVDVFGGAFCPSFFCLWATVVERLTAVLVSRWGAYSWSWWVGFGFNGSSGLEARRSKRLLVISVGRWGKASSVCLATRLGFRNFDGASSKPQIQNCSFHPPLVVISEPGAEVVQADLVGFS